MRRDEENCVGSMRIFVAVARAKSFTRAAAATNLPTSTLSRRVSELERTLGIRLLNRSTRRVEITEDGFAYLDHAERIIENIRQMHDDLRDRSSRPGGLLRVSLPESVAMQLAPPWFAEFAHEFPDIHLEIHTAPDHLDLLADNYDICIYDREVRDSGLTVRRLTSFSRALCASPTYIAEKGMPSHPHELGQHRMICAGADEDTRRRIRLSRGKETVTVSVSGMISTRSLVLAPELAKVGMGIASIILDYFPEEVKSGGLIPVLPDWKPEPLSLLAILPSRTVPPKARAFLDFFADKIHGHSERLRASSLIACHTSSKLADSSSM